MDGSPPLYDGRYGSSSPGVRSTSAPRSEGGAHTVTSTTLFIGGRVVSTSPPAHRPLSPMSIVGGDQETVSTHIRAHQNAVDNAILQAGVQLHGSPYGQLGASPGWPQLQQQTPAPPSHHPAAASDQQMLHQQMQHAVSCLEQERQRNQQLERQIEQLVRDGPSRNHGHQAAPSITAGSAGSRRKLKGPEALQRFEAILSKKSNTLVPAHIRILIASTEQQVRRVYWSKLMSHCRSQWKKVTLKLWYFSIRQLVEGFKSRLRARYWRKWTSYSATKLQRGVMRLVSQQPAGSVSGSTRTGYTSSGRDL